MLACSDSLTGASCSVNCATRRVEVVDGDVLPSVAIGGITRLDAISIQVSLGDGGTMSTARSLRQRTA